jgi:hypothetical protein
MKTFSGITLALVMLVAAGCAGGIGPATVAPTVDITGRWVGSWVATNPALGSGVIEMTVTQKGSQFSGRLVVTGAPTNPTGPTEGIVSGNEVSVTRPTNFTGNLTAQGDTMKGNVNGTIDANVTLTRQK